MTDALTARQISRVAANGHSGAGLRVSASVLKELKWGPGALVRWHVVDGHLEGRRVRLAEVER